LATFVHKEEEQFGEVVLSCENLSLAKTFRDISFSLHRGEILGLTGLVGCGANELIGSLFGEYKYDGGHLEIEGKRVKKQTPAAIAKLGVAYVPDDRKVKGLNTIGSVQSNIVITVLDEMGKAGFVRRKKEDARSEEMVEKLGVKVKSIDQLARTLSGGNQQKVVLAKWLQKDLKILLLSEPTRGIDAAAKKEIHDMIKALAEDGLSILLVSSELEEIVDLSDNVIVLYEGEITGRFSLHNSSKGQIIGAMYGERAAI
jgi:ABC-type sugar transport system ATPase subunit